MTDPNNLNTDLNRVVARPVLTNVQALVIGGVDYSSKYKCRWLPLSTSYSNTSIEISVLGYNFFDITKQTKFGLNTTKSVAPRLVDWTDTIHKNKKPTYKTDPTSSIGNDLFDTLTLYVSSDCPNMWSEEVIIQEYDLYSQHVLPSDRSPTMAERYPTFTAHEIPRQDIQIINQNKLVFLLPPPRVSGLINVIVANRAGYGMCDTASFHGLDQQVSDQTARFSTGVTSNGLIVVGTGEGCVTPPPFDPYLPSTIPCDHEEWF